MGSYKLDVYKKGSYLYTVATWKLYWTMITLLITFLWLPPLSKLSNHMQFCVIFGPGGLRAPCVAWPLLLPSFSLSLSFLLFSPPSFTFYPLQGISRV